MLLDVAGENSLRARTRNRSNSPFVKRRSKSPLRPLACEDSLGNSNTSRSMDDDGSFLAFRNSVEDLSRRTQSTPTLTSKESSHGNSSFRNTRWSPTPAERRLSNSMRKSPRRSPRNEFHFADFSESGIIGSPPLTNTDRLPHYDSVDRPSSDGVSSYYQPSKASLGSQGETSKKPKRIRSRSKGNKTRQSMPENSNKPSSAISGESSKRSKSCEPKKTKANTTSRSRSCERNGSTKKTKKKNSPSLSRHRKRPSSTKTFEKPSSAKSDSNGNNIVYESWSMPNLQDNMIEERQKQRTEKIKKIKHTSKTKKKKSNDGKPADVNDVLTFFEDLTIQKVESQQTNAPAPRGLGKRSESARCVTRRSPSPVARRSLSPSKYSTGRSGSPSKYSIGDYSPHVLISEQDIRDTSSVRRNRRSSAPAKAMASFQQYRQSIGGYESEEFDDSTSMPVQNMLLDVSELAALEIIRLGQDNSLKLDLFDLMKHLKRQQLKKPQW